MTDSVYMRVNHGAPFADKSAPTDLSAHFNIVFLQKHHKRFFIQHF